MSLQPQMPQSQFLNGNRQQQVRESIFPPQYAQNKVAVDSSDSEFEEHEVHQCDNPNCSENADYEIPAFRDFPYYTKRYYILALIVIVMIGMNEEILNPRTTLHNQARMLMDMPNFQEFLVSNYKPMGHLKEAIEECPNNMTFKEFMTQLIRDFQPCVFRDLVQDWPALTKWTNHTYLREVSGNETIAVQRKKSSDRWAEFGKEFSKPFLTFDEFLAKYQVQTKKKADYSYYIVDEEPLSGIKGDFQEPNVTEQILNLEDVTFSIGKSPKLAATYRSQDQMICVVAGRHDLVIIPPWEWFLIEAGGKSIPKDVSTINFSKHDPKRHPKFEDATKFRMKLSEGDCIYIPAYWWVQADSQSENAITITHWYQISSEWLRLVFQGIEKGYI